MSYLTRIETTLRPPEVELLDEWARTLDTKTMRKFGLKHGRAGAMRGAIRYALEHKKEVEEWLRLDTNHR